MNSPDLSSVIVQRWSQVGKEFMWVAAGQSLSFAGAVLGVKLLTTLLSPAEYGELALGVSLAGAMNMFAYGPLGQVVLRFYSICREENTIAIFFSLLRRIHIEISYLLLVIGILGAVSISVIWGLAWGLLALSAVLFGVVSGLQGSLLSLANAMRRRPVAAAAQTADVWLRMVLSALFLTVIGRTGLWAMLGYLIGSALVVSWQLRYLPDEAGKNLGTVLAEDSRALTRRFWEYGVPFVSFAGVAVIGQYADRWLLQGFWGQREVGVYAALYQVASAPIAFVMAVVNQVVIPVVFSGVGNLSTKEGLERGRSLLLMTELVLVGVFVLFTAAMFVWGEPLVRLLTSVAYAKESQACWLIMLALAIFNLGQLSSILGYSLNRTDLYVWPKVLHGAAVLGLGGLLVGHQAIHGMASAMLGASLIYVLSIKMIHVRFFGQNANHVV